MKNGNVNDFVEKTTYEECAVMYNGTKYFFHGLIYDNITNSYSYDIDIWDSNGIYVKTIFNQKSDKDSECIKLVQNEPIFNGKTFWDAEADMEWIEW